MPEPSARQGPLANVPPYCCWAVAAAGPPPRPRRGFPTTGRFVALSAGAEAHRETQLQSEASAHYEARAQEEGRARDETRAQDEARTKERATAREEGSAREEVEEVAAQEGHLHGKGCCGRADEGKEASLPGRWVRPATRARRTKTNGTLTRHRACANCRTKAE